MSRTRSFGEEWLEEEKDTELVGQGSPRAEQKEGEQTSTIDRPLRGQRDIKMYEMGKITSRTDSKLSKESGDTISSSERKKASEQQEDMQVMPEDVEVEIV